MKKDYSRSKLAIFASYIVPHRKAFAIDMALSVGIAAVDLLFPYVSRWSMRNLLPEGLFRTFFTVMLIMFAAYLIRAVCQYFVTVVGHRMGTLVEADMRRDVFSHMQELSYSFFDRNRTGVLLARVTNDLFEIVELAHHGVVVGQPYGILYKRHAVHSDKFVHHTRTFALAELTSLTRPPLRERLRTSHRGEQRDDAGEE